MPELLSPSSLNLNKKVRANSFNLYEIPVPFWQKVLGNDLHFHLGYFPKPGTSLEDSMRIAVRELGTQIPRRLVKRVLDVGCGWGGPAFELARIWKTEVLGLTSSNEQTHFINGQASLRKLPVRAMTVDVERYGFDEIGTFDVLWLYEVLEHIADRRSLFVKLCSASRVDTNLAIAMSCRSPYVSREQLYNEFLGIQPLETLPELVKMLGETGWKVLTMVDCTALTLPVWRLWLANLNKIADKKYREQTNKLTVALSNTKELYRIGKLQSVQIVARRCP
ncbi:MAG TPA: hypothetical protein DCZ05_09045 [Deltaproteobacteria bacterium]|nr:hypothetical protein [Deltaproteobacteria bacterium]